MVGEISALQTPVVWWKGTRHSEESTEKVGEAGGENLHEERVRGIGKYQKRWGDKI
jgi:hypothetical protein